MASALTVNLAWNPVPETGIKGYRVYVGTTSNQYSRIDDAGSNTTCAVSGLISEQTYYFAVAAVNVNGVEGERSEEILVPVTSNPQASPDRYSVTGDHLLEIPAPGVLSNDSDMDSTQLVAVLVSGPANGTVLLSPNGGFAYTPRAGFAGSDSFVYRASDGIRISETAVVEILVKQPTIELLVNGGFEEGYFGWNSLGNQKIQLSGAPYVSSSGNQLVTFNDRDLPANGVLSQSFATIPGQAYSLSFDSTVLSFNFNSQTLLVEVMGQTNLLSQSITIPGQGKGLVQWTSRTFGFVADSTWTTLTFKDKSSTTQSIDLLLDNVSVSGPAKSNSIPPLAETSGTPSVTGKPGAINVGMAVTNPGRYVLERSEDLVNWQPIGSIEVVQPGRISFVDSTPPGAAGTKVFYRIVFHAGANAIPPLAESSGAPTLSGKPGAINVGMAVVNPGLYVLERSVDLVRWEVIGSTQVTQAGRISFLDTTPPAKGTTKAFYRIGFK